MKSLMWLLKCMLDNTSIRCSTDTHRDFITISRRIKREGESFLTITLPNYATDFEWSLEHGYVAPDLFMGFHKRKALPVLFRGLLERVFDPVSGRLLDEPCLEAIASIRQICLMFKKVNLPCSEERVRKAFTGYFKCESEMAGLTLKLRELPKEVWNDFGRLCDLLWPMVLADSSRAVIEGSLVPKHGPGATAERISGNQKYRLKTWHERLQTYFPHDYYGLVNPRWFNEEDVTGEVHFAEPGAEEPVRVITVPKTLKTPRIIAIEPVCMQYTQQSLSQSIMRMIEKNKYTCGHVNFVDQQVNRDLAQKSSYSGKYATVDLSEASDRVHKDLVERMFSGKGLEALKAAVFACRSTRADVNGTITVLNKFASMGSALCFPIEAMLFYTICVLARLHMLNLPVDAPSIMYASRDVYVYGDDLIVPANEVEAILYCLELFGLKVNKHKTFSTGKFRESCGMDAYDGVDVTPVYLRQMPPQDRHSRAELVSFVAFANQLYTRGWWTAAARVREYIESIFGSMPHVQETSPGLGWTSVDNRYSIHAWCSELHRPLVKAFVTRPKYRQDRIDGHDALLKYLLKVGDEPTFEGHLERSVRPGCASIKSRWVPPY